MSSADTNDHTKDNSKSNFSVLLTKFFAGGAAAAIAVTATAPLERTKLLLQIQDKSTNIPSHMRYKGIIDCLRRIPKEQGFLSFWRGNTASVVRCFPYHAFNFSLKDTIREAAITAVQPKTVKSQMIINLFTGGLAGSISLIIIYPLDYARTRLAMDIGHCKSTREYHGMWACLKDAYEANGIKGCYRGCLFSVFGVFIYRASYFGLYDSGVDFIPSHLRTIWMQFLLAEFSATSAGLISFPMDTVRRTMMMQSGKKPKAEMHRSSIDCFKYIYKNDGIRGFYRGSLANIIRGTGGAIMLMLYDNLNFVLLGDKGHHFHQKPMNLQEDKSTTSENGPDTSSSAKDPKMHIRGSLCNF